MSAAALGLALASAAVHALWNALLAGSRDTHATTAAALLAAAVLFAPVGVLTWDVDGSAVPFIVASAVSWRRRTAAARGPRVSGRTAGRLSR